MDIKEEDLKLFLGNIGAIPFYLQKISASLERIAKSLEHMETGEYRALMEQLRKLSGTINITNLPKEKKITEKQAEFLRKHGVEVSKDMSRLEASNKIKEIIEKSKNK